MLLHRPVGGNRTPDDSDRFLDRGSGPRVDLCEVVERGLRDLLPRRRKPGLDIGMIEKAVLGGIDVIALFRRGEEVGDKAAERLLELGARFAVFLTQLVQKIAGAVDDRRRDSAIDRLRNPPAAALA